MNTLPQTLSWQQTDKNQFAVFIRDLSHNVNNVKHMIEDTLPKQTKPSYKKHGKKGKKPVIKKKDLIIQEQTKLRNQKLLQEDLSKLTYLLEHVNYEDPYVCFSQMKTSEGLLELKFRLLSHLWSFKKQYFPHVMNLYFQLVGKAVSEEHRTLLSTIESKLKDTEYKLYMMKHLSHLLPPLNIHEPKVKKLDDWQITVVNHIRNKESVVVKAPTSSGKSFVGLSAGVLHKKLLYVCPAKPIAYQVGAHFTLMGYKVHYLLDTLCHQGYDDKTTIFVGVPKTIEDTLYKLGVTFDYAVFDEIHNLNKPDDGHIYENILKLIQCPCVALSATIKNIDFLIELFSKIHDKPTHYVEYTKRFINQQKMIYDQGRLQKIHPLACIELEDLNDNFLTQNLQFTPYDSAILWETIEEVFELSDSDEDEFSEELDDCSPDNYFGSESKILTLDDTRDYETFIKGKLVEIAKESPRLTRDVLSKFHIQLSSLQPENVTEDIIELFKQCKQQECLPMLVFQTNTVQCKKIFSELYTQIAKSELNEYPFHYDILEYKDELYTKYRDKREQFIESMKIGKTKDAQTEKQTKVDRFDRNAERQYISDVLAYYESCIHTCERTAPPELKKIQIKHLKREMRDYQTYPSFGNIDVFQKHKDFCFSTSDPMSGDQIRSIRREIQKTLGIKLPYEHELFQMLKRGIGIYTEDMPEEYKWILQKLMDDKKIGIVISDRTLCLGIDLPIRSSCLLGLPGHKEFTIDDYLQMSGRAGRRGKDDRGNTIFYNLNFKDLMKGELPRIVGSSQLIPSNYQAFPSPVTSVYENIIHPDRGIDTEYQATSEPKLQWLLRYQEKVPEFIKSLPKWNKQVYGISHDSDKDLCIVRKLLELFDCDIEDEFIATYKKKVITHNLSHYQHMCRLIEIVYNSLKDKRYTHLKTRLHLVYQSLKDMILSYQGLK